MVTLHINGNTADGSSASAARIILRSNIDYRGRGILLRSADATTEWYSGVPYTGAGFSIGYDASNSQPDYKVNSKLFINTSGNVGIGTTSPGDYKLNVSGKIRTDEVVVNTTGADYVFEPGYKLPELSEVESFIKENNHLPDIQPAAEMKENGLNVSEMQTKLLQKVEELTLYTIEQNKKLEQQDLQLQQQDKKIIELEKQNEKIKALEEKIEKIESVSNNIIRH